MNADNPSKDVPINATREEMMAAMFASMVMQQVNMAMMLLGKAPHPESGETLRDFEGAKMFIDQLEMLEIKTKGNLSKQEESLLKQSLMATRMAFVEAIENQPAKAEPPPPAPATPNAVEPPQPVPEVTAASTEAEADSKKRFSKKY
jgi:hypothetical protein